LLKRYDSKVRSVARRVGLNHADVADVSQLTWMRLLGSVNHIRDPERLGGWLKTTSHNEALALATRDTRRQRGEASLCVDPSQARWNEPPESKVVAGEQRAELNDALHALPLKRQQVVRLLADGASYAEVCAITGLPQGSIGPTWGRSIRRLQKTTQAARLLAERGRSADGSAA
jgi:RNA polymerase sigma factor (sigma-70 family)